MKTPFLLVLFAAVACAGQDTSSPRAPSTSGERGNQQSATQMQPSSGALDSRQPVPLLPHMAQHQRENMRAHLAAVQGILAAISSNDFVGAEKAAARIESSEQTQQMRSHMGLAAPDFTAMALNFHRTADGIGAAARQRDEKEVIKAVSATVSACVKCHETYRQQVVDDETWSRLSAAKP